MTKPQTPETQANNIENIPRFARVRHIGRNALAAATGLSVAAGLTYLGYKIGTDVVGPENNSNKALYYAGVAMPTIVIGGLGTLGGFYAGVAVAGNEKAASNSKPSEGSKPEPVPSPDATTEAPEQTPQPLEMADIAQATNDGSLSREIDAANGNDPELAV